MRNAPMSKVVELFGYSAESQQRDWLRIVREQQCPFLSKRCYKVRKSEPDTSIGTCTVLYGKAQNPVVICPARFLERYQIFRDCLDLLTRHKAENELRLVQEISIPGGNVDYFLTSVYQGKVEDFVGIEVQALDTTGTVWPQRQQLLEKLGILSEDSRDIMHKKSYGINWKMTAKTILIQLYHKIHTFEHVNKKLVLVLQDKLFSYMQQEFTFDHLNNPAELGDSLHMHVYQLKKQPDRSLRLDLASRLSTNAEGLKKCLGLQAEAQVSLSQIVAALEAKLLQSALLEPD